MIKEEILKKVKDKTSTYYNEIKITEDEYLILPEYIEPLIWEIGHLEEKIEDLENKEESNPDDEYYPENYL